MSALSDLLGRWKGKPNGISAPKAVVGFDHLPFEQGVSAGWDAALDLAIHVADQFESSKGADAYDALFAYSRALGRGLDRARNDHSLVLNVLEPESAVIEVALARILPAEARESLRKAMIAEAEKARDRLSAETVDAIRTAALGSDRVGTAGKVEAKPVSDRLKEVDNVRRLITACEAEFSLAGDKKGDMEAALFQTLVLLNGASSVREAVRSWAGSSIPEGWRC